RPLGWSQLTRGRCDHREARLEQLEPVDVERSGDELGGALAQPFDISVGGTVGRRDDTTHAWVIIAERRVWRECLRGSEHIIECGSEIVDYDHRALRIADAP